MLKRFRTVALGAGLVAATTTVIAVAAAMPPSTQEDATVAEAAATSTFTYEDGKSFTGWSLYDTGTSFEGNDLKATFRRNDPATYSADSLAESPGANYVSLIYGTCFPTDEIGCAPPLEIQVWPACSRKLQGQFVDGEDVSIPSDETLIVRGIQATFYDDWTRLEMPTGDSIVVLFGYGRDQLLRAARSLKGLNNGKSQSDSLPAAPACQ